MIVSGGPTKNGRGRDFHGLDPSDPLLFLASQTNRPPKKYYMGVPGGVEPSDSLDRLTDKLKGRRLVHGTQNKVSMPTRTK